MMTRLLTHALLALLLLPCSVLGAEKEVDWTDLARHGHIKAESILMNATIWVCNLAPANDAEEIDLQLRLLNGEGDDVIRRVEEEQQKFLSGQQATGYSIRLRYLMARAGHADSVGVIDRLPSLCLRYILAQEKPQTPQPEPLSRFWAQELDKLNREAQAPLDELDLSLPSAEDDEAAPAEESVESR